MSVKASAVESSELQEEVERGPSAEEASKQHSVSLDPVQLGTYMCIYVCVCVCPCLPVRVRVCTIVSIMYVYTSVCVCYTYTCTCTYVCMLRLYPCAYVHYSTHVRVYFTYMCVCVSKHICMCNTCTSMCACCHTVHTGIVYRIGSRYKA